MEIENGLIKIHKGFVTRKLMNWSVLERDDFLYYPLSYHTFFKETMGYDNIKNEINKGDLHIDFNEEDYQFLTNPKFKEPLPSIINEILSYRQGIIQLPTGFGKTHIITMLIKYLALQQKRRVLVLTTTVLIKQEIFKRLGIDEFYYNDDSLFNIIHITGFSRSKVYGEMGNKLENYEILIYDESDSVPNELFNLLTTISGVKYKYGFSATPDRLKGGRFEPRYTDLSKMGEYARYLFSYFGSCIIYRELKHELRLNVIHKEIKYKAIKWSGADYYMILNAQLKSLLKQHDDLKPCIEYILQNKIHVVLCVLKTNTLIDLLVPLMQEMSISYVRWTSSGIYWETEDRYIKTQNELKELVLDKKIEFIFATDVISKGVDLNILTDILILQSSQYGYLTQIIGRTVRYDKPQIWLIDPQKKGELYYSMQKRRRVIEESYSDLVVQEWRI